MIVSPFDSANFIDFSRYNLDLLKRHRHFLFHFSVSVYSVTILYSFIHSFIYSFIQPFIFSQQPQMQPTQPMAKPQQQSQKNRESKEAQNVVPTGAMQHLKDGKVSLSLILQ